MTGVGLLHAEVGRQQDFSASERIVIVKAEQKSTMGAPEQGDLNNSTDSLKAHLAFRKIVVHEFAVDSEPQALRLNFHYRNHSKHLSRPPAA